MLSLSMIFNGITPTPITTNQDQFGIAERWKLMMRQ
jgi:hypothetical protein